MPTSAAPLLYLQLLNMDATLSPRVLGPNMEARSWVRVTVSVARPSIVQVL